MSACTHVFPSQERFQVKNPPHTYIQKLQSFLDPSVTRKVRCEAGYPHLAALCSPVGFRGKPCDVGQDSRSWVSVFWGSVVLWGSGWLGTDGRTVTTLLGAFPFLFCPFCLYCKVDLGASISDRESYIHRNSGGECRSQPKS